MLYDQVKLCDYYPLVDLCILYYDLGKNSRVMSPSFFISFTIPLELAIVCLAAGHEKDAVFLNTSLLLRLLQLEGYPGCPRVLYLRRAV